MPAHGPCPSAFASSGRVGVGGARRRSGARVLVHQRMRDGGDRHCLCCSPVVEGSDLQRLFLIVIGHHVLSGIQTTTLLLRRHSNAHRVLQTQHDHRRHAHRPAHDAHRTHELAPQLRRRAADEQTLVLRARVARRPLREQTQRQKRPQPRRTVHRHGTHRVVDPEVLQHGRRVARQRAAHQTDHPRRPPRHHVAVGRHRHQARQQSVAHLAHAHLASRAPDGDEDAGDAARGPAIAGVLGDVGCDGERLSGDGECGSCVE
mmetsp:Transcript_5020/g.16176  ORF Transcript_5020/g.16176 Transcript_5020/m.16176 type:complete len:261 (-) Transcript_5020:623-1405(-)